MTAIRNFPHAPLPSRGASRPLLAPLQDFGRALWHGLTRIGQLRAATQLDAMAGYRAAYDPALARQLHDMAEQCRRDAANHPLPWAGRSAR